MGKSYGLLSVLLVFFLLCKAQAAVHYYDFLLVEKNFTKLCSTKSILTVNGSFPGPTLSVRKGDVAYVTVHNNGTYGVTIHWHGVRQPRDPWSDGPENITQCPIAPGTSFTQKVNFTSEEGTLWWHAHSDWSRATVHGAIEIKPALESLYPFTKPDGQEIFIIGEWYKGDVMEIIETALATGDEPNASDGYTINGQFGDFYNCSNETTFRFLVDYGKNYLFRIINAGMNEEHYFGIAKHNLTVVGVDAAYVKPVTTTYLVIAPGQTMDVLVSANQTPDHYYIAAIPFHDGTATFDNNTATAILQYNGNYTATFPTSYPYFPYYNDSSSSFNFTKSLKSLADENHTIHVPTTVDRRIYMAVAINELPCSTTNCSGPDGNMLAASLNNVSFDSPTTDILEAYYWNKSNIFTTDFPQEPPYFYNFTGDVSNISVITSTGTRAIMLDYNETVEIVWQGTNFITAENHPMHLHGFSFFVVGMGWGNFDNNTDPQDYNLVDPPELNTVGLPKNGWVAMRFVADNPGVWFMHCHLERHSSWGMETVFIVKDGGTEETSMFPPPHYMPPCRSRDGSGNVRFGPKNMKPKEPDDTNNPSFGWPKFRSEGSVESSHSFVGDLIYHQAQLL